MFGKAKAAYILFIGASVLILSKASIAATNAAVCDVVATGSVKIDGIKTTLNSAQLLWKEGHSNGFRFFCYGLTPQVTCPSLVGSRSQPKVEGIYNLKPQTKYYFKYHANWGTGTMKSPATGSFTTDTSSCGMAFTPVIDIRGQVISQGGEPLENVRVVVSKTKGGASVDNNNSSISGAYFLKVIDPGKYYLSYSLAPFATPAIESVTVVAGTLAQMPPVKMGAGGYQVGGTVFGKPTGGTLGAVLQAEIKIFPSTDSSKSQTKKTDPFGHFNFPLVPGTYTLHANFGGKNFSVAKTVVVDKDLKGVDLTLTGEIQNLVVGLHEGKNWPNGFVGGVFSGTEKTEAYHVNGVRLRQKENRTNQVRAFQAP